MNEVTLVRMPDYNAWLVEALEHLSGSAFRLQIYKKVWESHHEELEGTDAFFQWQHQINSAAEALRRSGALMPVHGRKHCPWTLVAEPRVRERRPLPAAALTLPFERDDAAEKR